MKVEVPYKVYPEDLPKIDTPRPINIPTTSEMIKMLNEAGQEPSLVAELKRLAKWRAESARKDVVFGGPGCGMCNDYGPNSPRF